MSDSGGLSVSASTIEIVKSTAPLFEKHGYAVVSQMYKTIFEASADVAHMFNGTNQLELNGAGSARQCAALAGAVAAYAANIDNAAALSGAIALIVDKHISLHVLPEHYPVVKEHLLAAVGTVMSGVVTPQIAAAWSEAYDALAKVLVDAEEQGYKDMEAKRGWRGFRSFQVMDKQRENDTVMSILLKPAPLAQSACPMPGVQATSSAWEAGSQIPQFQPGQYVGLRAPICPCGRLCTRNYTVSSAPNERYIRLTVRRLDGDYGPVKSTSSSAASPRGSKPLLPSAPRGMMTTYLHDRLQIGDLIDVTAPTGGMALSDELMASKCPLYFIAAGIGVTPIVSMIEHLVAEWHKGDVYVVCVNKSPEREPMHKFLQRINNDHDNFHITFEYTEGQPNGREVALYTAERDVIQPSTTHDDAHYFTCGPPGFLVAATAMLDGVGIPKARQHSQLFGPMM